MALLAEVQEAELDFSQKKTEYENFKSSMAAFLARESEEADPDVPNSTPYLNRLKSLELSVQSAEVRCAELRAALDSEQDLQAEAIANTKRLAEEVNQLAARLEFKLNELRMYGESSNRLNSTIDGKQIFVEERGILSNRSPELQLKIPLCVIHTDCVILSASNFQLYDPSVEEE